MESQDSNEAATDEAATEAVAEESQNSTQEQN